MIEREKKLTQLNKKYNVKHLNFVVNGNINLRILNKCLNEYVTTPLASNFCYTMKK